MNRPANETVQLNYRDIGSGEPVIFIHGWAADSSVWDPVLEELSKNIRMILVDLRGCGESPFIECEDFIESSVLDVAVLAKKLGLNRFSVLGWSLGGMIAMKLAARLSDKVDRSILVSTTPKFVKDGTFDTAIEKTAYQNMLRILKRSPEKTLEYFRSILFSEKEKITKNLESLQKLASNTRPQMLSTLVSSLESLGRADFRSVLPMIKQKTLIIHGNMDKICFFGAGEYLSKHIKNSKFMAIDNAGHMPFLTQKKEVTKAIQEFIADR